jgi:FKBP-type peptidyl-prolyl cis-trans isomerase FkpA
MKKILFSLLLLSAVSLVSCRKSGLQLDIKQYDQQQILSYMAANGVTNAQKDTVGGDTTGMYYQVLNAGNGAQLNYPDSVSFVYTIRSFDGKFIASDTVMNHYAGLVGHATPNGLMLGIRNDLKYKGGKVRFFIPSHLAYGVNGVGTGSKTITNGRIAGNQCLDYTVEVINDQKAYDNLAIKNYMTANNLTGYTETASGLWYKITIPGTSTDPITYNSTVTLTYTGLLFNGNIFSNYNTTGGTAFNIPDVVPGFQEGLEHATAGSTISFIMPSALAYGAGGGSGVPANACLRYDCAIITVTP